MQWSPLLVTGLFTTALVLLVFFVFPGPQRVHLAEIDRQMGLRKKIQALLHSAGIFDRAPGLLLVSLASFSLMIGALAALVFNSLLAFFIGPILVPLGAYFYVRERRRRFLERASDELVPFLNRIATAVISGQPSQQAYLDAVEESVWLREVLEDSAARISSGERFSHALLSTLPVLPLRMWSVFVRQLELYEEVGGDVGKAIEKSVSQVNTMLQLQAEARADFALQSWQQRVIILIVIGATLIWGMIDPARVSRVLGNPAGVIGLLIGLGIIVFGVWFLQKQLRDLERKLSF